MEMLVIGSTLAGSATLALALQRLLLGALLRLMR
jgi:hypothetical protein